MLVEKWLKWIATASVILGAILTSADIQPYNMIVFNFGNICWLAIGIMWKEKSLVVLNIGLIAIYAAGMLRWYH